MPRLPRDGLTPGITWTDTLEATQKGGGSEVSRRAILHSTAAAWEDHAGTRSLRLEATSTYQTQAARAGRSEEHTSELQSRGHLVCRLLLEKKKNAGRRNGRASGRYNSRFAQLDP